MVIMLMTLLLKHCADVLTYSLLFFVMTLPMSVNLIIFAVFQLKASIYQLVFLTKGQNIVAGKSSDGIGTTKTCTPIALE